MKNIVIAAGYATRLGELTKNFPKPLLKIGERSILGRMLDDIDQIPEIDEHIIITNHKFAHIFEDWKKDLHYSKPITIVDDGTETNDTRLGAVCDLLFAMKQRDIDDKDRIVQSAIQNYSYVNKNDIRFEFDNPDALDRYTEEEARRMLAELAE